MRPLDLTGQRFGRLEVLGRAGSKCGHTLWHCRCDCGNETYVLACGLRSGNVVSCGCWKNELAGKGNLSHGKSKSRLYEVWKAMRQRCNNPNHDSYKNYGGRGIYICDEWNDYTAFEEWAIKNGYGGSAKFGECTIERKDNSGPYSPDNCVFANWSEQQNNTRNNHRITIDGETKTLTDWCEIYGIRPSTVLRRIGLGWSEEKSITTPTGAKNPIHPTQDVV